MEQGGAANETNRQTASSDESSASPAPPSLPRRRRSSFTFRVIAVLASLGFVLVLAEITLLMFFSVTDVAFMFWDPLIGPRRSPNQTGTYFAGLEIQGRYRFNAHGWNNLHDTYSTVKPAGARRVCLVGDSMVEAMQVNVEDTMAAVAERKMTRPDRPVEWYTFANSGYGTTHEYLLIRHYALDYRPDVVVILFIANDPTDCSAYLAPQEDWMAKMLLADDGELVYFPPAQYVPSTLKRISARSALVRYLFIQQRLFERGASPLAPGQLPVREQTLTKLVTTNGKVETMEDRVARTWELIEAVLRQTKKECAQRGAELLLVYQGHRFEMQAAAEGQTYTPQPRDVDPFCVWERLNEMGRQYLEPIARRQAIHYLDLTDAMVKACAVDRTRFNFIDDGHFNTFGHRVAGEAMASKVEEILAGRQEGGR